ncbi:MAG: carbohydrate kinase [Eubacteriaceae bacterium]|nr:carbohydrate kinase [Eubacteriaceae bacterium]
MKDITALGEILIDFSAAGTSASGRTIFEQNPGGAPANMLTQASRLGMSCAFIGKAGSDMHGKFLKSVLEEENIDTSGVILDAGYPTTLAFVDIDPSGERSFAFYRKNCADTMLTESEIDLSLIRESRIFHFGTLSLTDEPACSATLRALAAAKDAGALISFDPNYRQMLWEGPDDFVSACEKVLPLCDMVKLSEEEAMLITGKEPLGAAEEILGMGASLCAVTLGAGGAVLACGKHVLSGEGLKVDAVDTTGAGDSFWGSLCAVLLSEKMDPKALGEEELTKLLQTALVASAICVTERGGIPAMPTQEKVRAFLNIKRPAVTDLSKQ